MSSKLNDIKDLSLQMGITKPQLYSAAITAAGVDLGTCDNNCFAIQVIGTVAGTEIVFAGKVQEATTATGTYADVSGGTFTTLTSTTGAGIVHLLNFQRTLQFVRYVAVITGTTSAVNLDVVIGGQKKQL